MVRCPDCVRKLVGLWVQSARLVQVHDGHHPHERLDIDHYRPFDHHWDAFALDSDDPGEEVVTQGHFLGDDYAVVAGLVHDVAHDGYDDGRRVDVAAVLEHECRFVYRAPNASEDNSAWT